MAYTTAEELREVLSPEGSDTGATAASLSDPALDAAIAEATAEIDAAVKGAPFADPVPTVVSAIARDVAAYLATLTFRQNVEVPPQSPIALRYARAKGILDAAAAGKLDFTEEQEAVAGEVAVANIYDGDLFTLEDFDLGIEERFLPPWNGGRFTMERP